MVTTQISSSGANLSSGDFKASSEDWSTKCWSTVVDANIDLRANVLGFNTVVTLWQLTKQMTDEVWSGVIVPQCLVHDFFLRTKQPQSILFVGGITGTMSALLVAPEHVFDGFKNTNISFMNDAGLFMFEKHLKNSSPEKSFGYSVYDKSELISGVDDKFEMITVQGWDIAYDSELLDALVDSLTPGGMLVVCASNDTSFIYSSSYKWHQYYGLHKALNEFAGTSYHFPHFYGTTVFVKE